MPDIALQLGAEVALHLVMGAVAGVLAGVFGIGGGMVIVPILTLLFTARGVAAEAVLPLAIGTSLATISLTALSSGFSHYRMGSVSLSLIAPMAPTLAAGTLAGAVWTPFIPDRELSLLVGGFTLLMAVAMTLLPTGTGERHAGRPELVAAGLGTGALSATFGIGGGNVLVPYFTWLGCKPHKAIGTAAVCGVPIALAGTLGYAFWSTPASTYLPLLTTGYVSVSSALLLALASIPCARLGARLAHMAPGRLLRGAFVLYLLAVTAYMFSRPFVGGAA